MASLTSSPTLRRSISLSRGTQHFYILRSASRCDCDMQAGFVAVAICCIKLIPWTRELAQLPIPTMAIRILLISKMLKLKNYLN